MFERLKRAFQKTRQPEVIVSFTSRPGRIDKMRPMLESLNRQTVKPDRIVLWLDKNEFPDQIDEVTQELSYFEEFGAQIEWIQNGFRSHNKYFWAFQKFPEDIIITIDDDLIYSDLMVEELLAAHQRFPEAVLSLRGHKILLNEENTEIAGYNDWVGEQREILDQPSHRIFFSDGAGALYPPHIFDESLFDTDKLKELCLNNDDIWLNVHLMEQGTPVVITGTSPYLHYVPDTQEDGLWQENVTRNDSILTAAFQAFPTAHSNLIEAVKNNS